ncbi:MAG: RIP metalloprotease RseP [Gammaproteobacteria bacterium]
MNVLISILAFVVAIGVLVTVHEFGHFIVARFLGVKVLRFSVGFGRPLWRWQRNKDSTEYVVAWIPLGGYNKFLDEREGEVPEAQQHLAFNRQSLTKRFPIVLAGPVFNLLFAVLAYWVIFMAGVPGIRPIVGAVPAGSPAAVAGFVSQDEILAVNGHATPTWETALVRLFEGVMRSSSVQVEVRTPGGATRALSLHASDTRKLTRPGDLLGGLGLSVWEPVLPPVVDKLVAGGTAAAAGLEPGDRFTAVDGTPIQSWPQLYKILQAAPGKTLHVVVERAGQSVALALPVAAESQPDGKTLGRVGVQVRVPKGFGSRLQTEQRYNPAAAFGQAFARTGNLSWLTLVASWNMVTGRVSLQNLSGPISIAQYAGYTAESGLVPFLAFLAIVSISLGILNLLPIPLLDGGHLLYYVLEALKGSPLSLRAEMAGQRLGIALLLMLMCFAIYNDLARLFG